MWLKARLGVADRADRWEARGRRLAEKLGWPQAWLHEFQTYLAQPRMTSEEFWVRYTLLRMDAETILKPVMSEAEAREFYQTHDYMLWRNVVHRRHSAWRRVLVTMRGLHGLMFEFGCGTAPVSSWVQTRKPGWHLCIADLLDAPHFKYAQWRVQRHGYHSPSAIPLRIFNVITALDVFEHLPDPEKVAVDLVDRLVPGGYLHWNFVGNDLRNDLDLATDEQRQATVAYLESALELVWSAHGYRVSKKR